MNLVLDDFVARRARTMRGNQILIALRLLLATLALTVLLIHERHQQVGEIVPGPLFLRPSGVLVLIVLALTGVYVLVARRCTLNPEWAPKLAFCQIFVDIFLISVLVWHTGGVSSQFVVLYLVAICAAAFVLKWNVAVIAAALSATLFCLITVCYSLGAIPEFFQMRFPGEVERLRNLQLADFVRLLLMPVAAFFLTAFLAGTLSRRLASARLVHDEILEGIGEGILALSPERTIIYHNREFQTLLGLDGGLLNQPLAQVLGAALDQHAAAALSDNQARRVETSLNRPGGRIVPFAVRLIPLTDPDDVTPRGLVLALDDITAEKKMEEYLKHKQRLETMGTLSASIAHEIRNPLASIRGAVQEIGRSVPIPEDKKVLLDIVLSESDRLDLIITDFLRYARIRPPVLIPTDLTRLLEDVRILLAARPEARDAAIEVLGDKPGRFAADAEQLRQVFLNLGINALQAMGDRPARRLTFRLQNVWLHRAPGFPGKVLEARVDRAGVLVEVEDTGPGIKPELLSKLFEPFFTTKPGGTGLGLAIAERIVQAHEGMITVESSPGQSTTFRIWLPSDLKVGAATRGAERGTRSYV